MSDVVIDTAPEIIAATTGHGATYRHDWEDELGDTPEARAAATAWRAWGIDRPGVLLRAEWFGGQIARFYDWMNPPDPRLRELFGVTYLDIAREEWWQLEWRTHVKLLQQLMRSGLSASEAASILHVSQSLSRGRRINSRALVRTVRRFKKLGFSVEPRNIWVLQNASSRQIEALHDAVFYCEYGREVEFKRRISQYWSRRRVVSQNFKSRKRSSAYVTL